MINNINNSVQTNAVSIALNKTQATTTQSINDKDLNTKSSIVQLQSKVSDVNTKADTKVTAENAKSFVADITSMLLKTDGEFHTNLNGFDAARLLA